MNIVENRPNSRKPLEADLDLKKDGDATLGKCYTELAAGYFTMPERPESNMLRRQSDSICGVVSVSGVFGSNGLLASGRGKAQIETDS